MNDRLLIRASAGSGKTFRLSGHFLKQLFLGERPETLLATTFTRKAAGEILGRVLTRLADAAISERQADDLRAFLELDTVTSHSARDVLVRLTRGLHRVRVCTLDSFFQQMARSLALELGLPAGWTIIDEWMEDELRQQAIDAVLAGQSLQDARELMHRLAKDRSKRSIRDLVVRTVDDFYAIFLQTDQAAWQRLSGARPLSAAEQDAAIADYQQCELPNDKRFEKARTGDVERFRSDDWEGFLKGGLAARVFRGESSYYNKEIPHDAEHALKRMVQHAASLLVGQLARQNTATWELIARFDHEYTRLQQEHGWLRFSDVTRILGRSQAASDGSRIAFRLDQSVRHLLLDEFQDTSPDQWRVLRALTAALTAGDSPSSFFCVGDPKQAIYGWRGGEAAILDVVERTVAGLASEPLVKSRRSSPVVIETVNRIFGNLADHANLGDAAAVCRRWVEAFPRHETAREDAPGYVRFAESPPLEGETSDEQSAAFTRWAAEEIRALHEQHPRVQIGVLTRRNRTVARLVHALAALGVPASEEGGTPPVDSPAALALMSLLHLASHPGCSVSAFHVAHSPLGPVVGLTEWNDQRRTSDVATEIRRRLLDEGYGRVLQQLSDAVHSDCSRRDRLRLRQIVAAGWEFDAAPSLNPCDFVRLIETSRFGRSEDAPVRVMTIHQSKGLEFDVVVLPELDTRLVQPPTAAVGRQSPEEPPDRVCIWRSQDLRSMLPDDLQEAFQQTNDRQVSEALCLLYVALTRAASSLHLLAPPFDGNKPPKTFQGLLLAALTDETTEPRNGTLFEAGDPHWWQDLPEERLRPHHLPLQSATPAPLTLRPLTAGRRRGLPRKAPSRHDERRVFVRSGPPDGKSARGTSGREASDREAFDDAGIDPLTRGTAMHAWFECIRWLDTDGRPAAEQLRERAARLALPESTVNTLLPDFFALLEQPELRTALSSDAAAALPVFSAWCGELTDGSVSLRVHNERSFAWLHDHAVVQGSIDRLVLAVRGDTVLAADVLDYKTDRLVGPRDRWIRDRSAHYASQLDEYRAAVRHCFRLSDDCISTRLALLEADAVVTI